MAVLLACTMRLSAPLGRPAFLDRHPVNEMHVADDEAPAAVLAAHLIEIIARADHALAILGHAQLVRADAGGIVAVDFDEMIVDHRQGPDRARSGAGEALVERRPTARLMPRTIRIVEDEGAVVGEQIGDRYALRDAMGIDRGEFAQLLAVDQLLHALCRGLLEKAVTPAFIELATVGRLPRSGRCSCPSATRGTS